METFNEFDQPGTAPQRNFSDIINHAFSNYFKVVGWCILLLVITIVISMIFSAIIGPITGYDPMAAQAEMKDISTNGGGITSFWSTMLGIPGYKETMGISYLFGLLIYPIYAGFLYLMQKGNTGQSVSFSDLFIGFRQNALQYIVYGLISGIAMAVALMLCVVPVFFVIPLFFLGMPIILFENATAMDAIKKSFNIAKDNYGTLLGVSFIALIIAIAGVILCGVGVLLTVPFFYAAMYSAYCAYCGTPRQINP